MAKLTLTIEMNHFPCLVVGGGSVALRKVECLLEAGADITVLAPHLHARLLAYADAKRITLVATEFSEHHVRDQRLVIAATNNESLNAHIADCAERSGVLVNVVDDATVSRVYFSSLLRRGALTIAISSEGNSPTLVRVIRSFIASKLPTNLATLTTQFSRWRQHLKARVRDGRLRQQIWQKLSAEFLLKPNFAMTEADIERAERTTRTGIGHVYLVGAGPGDPQLLTLRAWSLLQTADVIVHDRLVSPDILALARRDAELIYVGKACAAHTMPQQKINTLLIELAQRGLTVVRLKGGDPFVFGRGGEEMQSLRAANIPVDIVPGITAALGCAAASQVPLTLRGVANRVQFLTAHSAEDGLPDLDWHSLHAQDLTLVFYMGLKNVAQVCEQLIAHGRAPETPAAIICDGTSATQKNIYARLVDLPLHVHEASSPSLIIVGDVVTWAAELSLASRVENLSSFPLMAAAS